MMIRFLYLYCILFLWSHAAFAQAPAAPTDVVAIGYEQHIALEWEANPAANITGYKIYRSTNAGASFDFFKQVGKIPIATDWLGAGFNGQVFEYQITTLTPGQESTPSSTVSASTQTLSDEDLLEMTQRATFRYFWDFGHPVSGMARERSNGNDQIVTTGGSGFGIMSIITGAERGWITRAQALDRMVQIASFLEFADRFHGVFPHWMNGTNGNVVPFSTFDDGGDLVETAFLMQGLLAARAYFDQNTPLETALRNVITGLWEAVEWDWYRRNNSGVLYWHWSPNHAWQMNFPLRGFNEAQIVYILAAASPTHPVPGSLYQSGWTANNYANPSIHFGQKIYCGPFGGGPMFFAHYSYLGFNPRGRKDAFCNYFVRNRNHALIQHAYSIANPKNYAGYSADCWGLTACDGPNGYSAHDIWPANDDGTLAPTAALASMPYSPAESLAALRHFYRALGEQLWGPYGFYDAFNLQQNWFAPSYLAIDQGPIVVMIENHRSGLFWDLFMQNPEIENALQSLGFQLDNTATSEIFLVQNGFDARLFPNPMGTNGGNVQIEIDVLTPQTLRAQLTDVEGRVLQTLFQKQAFSTDVQVKNCPIPALPAGQYWIQLQSELGALKTLPLQIN